MRREKTHGKMESYPERRDLDNEVFIVARDGKYDSVCFTDLTQSEIDEHTTAMTKTWWKMLAIFLGNRLRKIADKYDIRGNRNVRK